MFSIKSVYITVPHESHNTILCVLTSMVHVALRQITVQYFAFSLHLERSINNSIKVNLRLFLILFKYILHSKIFVLIGCLNSVY